MLRIMTNELYIPRIYIGQVAVTYALAREAKRRGFPPARLPHIAAVKGSVLQRLMRSFGGLERYRKFPPHVTLTIASPQSTQPNLERSSAWRNRDRAARLTTRVR
jgi:hypothetical protein